VSLLARWEPAGRVGARENVVNLEWGSKYEGALGRPMLLEKPLPLTREHRLPGPRVLPIYDRQGPQRSLFNCVSEASLSERQRVDKEKMLARWEGAARVGANLNVYY
jgi:hypothetical protein